jgi:hypothetical protein
MLFEKFDKDVKILFEKFDKEKTKSIVKNDKLDGLSLILLQLDKTR